MQQISTTVKCSAKPTTEPKEINSNFGTIFGIHKLFSKKIHSRGKLSKYYTSRVIYIPFYSPYSQTFGTKLPKCRRYGITIIYRGINIWHTIATDKAQLAHRYATVIAKWSRSPQSTWEQPKSHRKPTDVLEMCLLSVLCLRWFLRVGNLLFISVGLVSPTAFPFRSQKSIGFSTLGVRSVALL